MPPSPAMRCSPGRDMRAEKHKRGLSFEGAIMFRERDDDLALFNEVQSKERDNFLIQSNDDFEDVLSNKLRYFSDYKLGINIPARGDNSDLLWAEGDKNDYDWLLTPPETPLFPSLDDEIPSFNLAQRGRARSLPISISRSSTIEWSHRSSRGSASPNRLSPSPRSGQNTYQSRGRPSSGLHSSPPSGVRPATPTRRPSAPPSKSSTAGPGSSTPTLRRMSTGSSGPAVPSRVRGNSPVKSNRGSSASPKLKAWQANIPGFPSEAPRNLPMSLADRPASYVRGSSSASRNGSKSGRQSMSPTASRSVCSSYSHDRDRLSSHSKGSVPSSGDDDLDSLQSLPMSSTEHSAPRSISTFSNSRGMSSPKKPTKIVTSSSAPKRSFDITIRQMDHRKGTHNMFRPLLSSVPSSTFYVGRSNAAQRSVISRNSSVTTSSNASSDLGTSGARDTEGSEQNQEDFRSDLLKAPFCNMQEEVFTFDTADSVNAISGNRNRKKLRESPDKFDRHPSLNPMLVGDEGSGQHDSAMAISVASEVLDVGAVLSDADNLDVMLLCCRCGRKCRANEDVDEDLKLCTDCRNAEIHSVVATLSETVMVCENSRDVFTNNGDHGSIDAFAPCVAKPESFAVTDVGESGIGCGSETSRHILPEGTGAQGELIVASQQVGNQTTVSSNTNLGGDTADQDLQNTSGYSNSKADVSEHAGISVLLTASSGKGPIVRTRTFTVTSITCDDFSYLGDSATSLRSSFGHGTASASSSVDLGSGRQIEALVHRQISSRKLDNENYRYDMFTKHQRSGSSLSGASTPGFQASSFVASSHEESLEVSSVNVGKDNLELLCVGLKDLSLASERELDNISNDIECDNNWRPISEFSSHTVNIHIGDTTSVSNFEEVLPEYTGVLANDSPGDINIEFASSDPERFTLKDEPMKNASVDRVDTADAPNLTSLDARSELESDNDHIVSPDSVFDIDSLNSKSSGDSVQDSSHPAPSSKDIATSVEESIDQVYAPSILEEPPLMLEGHGNIHSKSLTLEEATDTVLFCSSIVHNLVYEAANIAAEKENSVQLWGSKPVVTVVGKSTPERRDLRSRAVSKRNAKPKKARQRLLETDSKPPLGNTAIDEKSDVSTHIVGVPNKDDSVKPPKLESKCNCTIM